MMKEEQICAFLGMNQLAAALGVTMELKSGRLSLTRMREGA